MYNEIVIDVRTSGDIRSKLSIIIGLHQGSTLNICLFALIRDEFT